MSEPKDGQVWKNAPRPQPGTPNPPLREQAGKPAVKVTVEPTKKG